MKDKTWEELKNDEVGTVYLDKPKGKLRFLIVRGPGSLCAYIGIPLKHPLAKQNYNDLPIDCHGGLTFGGKGEGGNYRPEGYWWYGWDYAHYRDASFFYFTEGHEWLVKEVEEDSWEAIDDFEKLAKLAEKIDKEK